MKIKDIMKFTVVVIMLLGSGSAYADPTEIGEGSLKLWLDGDDASTLYTDSACSTSVGNADRVGCWKDKSGEANNVLQPVLADRPTNQTNQLNGKATLDFVPSPSGNDNRLVTSSSGQIIANGPYTKFVVFKYDTTSRSNNLISSDNTGSAFWGASRDGVFAWNLSGSVGDPGHVGSGPVGTTNYHVATTRYDNVASDGFLSVMNIDGNQEATNDGAHSHTAQALSIGTHGLENGLDGKIAEAIVYNKALSDEEIDCVESYLGAKWGVSVSSAGAVCVESDTISLAKSNYPEYKIFQRDINNNYDFNLSGTFTGTCTTIEASFDGTAYGVIDSAPTSGTFTGTLTASVGQGALSVRCANNTDLNDTVNNIGIGDVYVVAGQSNAEGHAQNIQLYTTVAPTANVFPTVYTDGDVWKVANDDTDPGGGAGSVWPILGGYIVENTGIPVSFITTADGGKGLVSPAHWTKGGNVNCAKGIPCYDNMLNQLNEANPNAVKAILWFQGETDASSAVSRTAYNSGLDQFIADVQGDFAGTPDLISGNIGPWVPSPVNSTQIRLATQDAWTDNASILHGPQAYDIHISDDGIGDTVHYVTDDEIQTLAFRWWKSLEEHYYGGSQGRGPVVSSAEMFLESKKINVDFTASSALQGGTSTAVWSVDDNGVDRNVVSAVVLDADTVQLTLATDINSINVSLTYAKDNTGENEVVLTDSTTGNTAEGVSPLPADVFSDFSVTVKNVTAAVMEDIAGNTDGIPATAAEINVITGVGNAISGVDYSTALAAGTYVDASNPTVAEIQAVVDGANASNVALAVIQMYANDNTQTAPTVQDYIDAGITGVDAENLTAVNAGIDASDTDGTDTLTEVQAIATAGNATADNALAVIQAYANDNTQTAPSVQDYLDAGITGVDADNLNAVNAGIDASDTAGTDTVAEVQTIADAGNATADTALALINAYGTDSSNPTPSVQDYSDAGITGVDADNLNAVNAGIDASDTAGTDTVAEVQTIADAGNATADTAFALINAYANDNTQTAPSVQDYLDAGITGVDADNLTAVNAGIDASDTAGTDTVVEVQTIADAGNATADNALAVIGAYASNTDTPNSATTPSVQDYLDAGITGVDEDNLNAVNVGIDASDTDGTDTVSEVQAISDAGNATADTALALINAYANDNTQTAPSVQDYIDAGITGVDAENLNEVNAGIDASNVDGTDTVAEVQAIVSTTNTSISAMNEAIEDIGGNNNNNPISSTELNSITGVSAAIENIDYSSQLENANYEDASAPTAAEIQAVITAYNVIVNENSPRDDKGTDATANTAVTVSVLENDSPRLESTSIKLDGTDDVGSSLVVEGEGVWSVEDGKIIFTPEAGFDYDPTEIKYSLTNEDGERFAFATVEVHYEGKVRDDQEIISDLSKKVVIDILKNDNGDFDLSTLEIVLPEGFRDLHEEATFSKADSGKILTVSEEGTWTVDSINGTITYFSEEGVEPTAISYKVKEYEKTEYLVGAKISIKKSAVAGVNESNEIHSDSVSIFSGLGLLMVLLLSTVFILLALRQEKK